MFPDELKRQLDLALQVVVGGPGNKHAAWFGQLLETGGDVHGIAVNFAALLVDDIAEVDPDAEADAIRCHNVLLPLGHALLEEDGAADRVDDAGELAQSPVADPVDDAAVVPGDERVDELGAVRLEPGDRAILVPLHQPRVADHVRREDGGEPAVRVGSGHGVALRDGSRSLDCTRSATGRQVRKRRSASNR